MCLQPTPEGAECLWRSDAGWQAVPDVRSSDEERPVTNRRTTWWRRYDSRRWRRTQPSSCVDVRHTTQPVRQVRRSRTMQTTEHEHSEFKLNHNNITHLTADSLLSLAFCFSSLTSLSIVSRTFFRRASFSWCRQNTS